MGHYHPFELPTCRADARAATLEPLLLPRFRLGKDEQEQITHLRGFSPDPPSLRPGDPVSSMGWTGPNGVIAEGEAWARHFGFYRQLAWLNSGGSWVGLNIEQRARPDGGLDYDAIGVTPIVHYAQWLSRLDREAGVLHLGPLFDDAVLSSEQIKVLRLMVFGYGQEAIAQRLGLTLRQVRNRSTKANAILHGRGLPADQFARFGPLEGAMRQSLLPFVMANPDWFAAPDAPNVVTPANSPDPEFCLPLARFQLVFDGNHRLVSLDPEGCSWLAHDDALPWDVVGMSLDQLSPGRHARSLHRYHELLRRAAIDGRATEAVWIWTRHGWQWLQVEVRRIMDKLLHAQCAVLTGTLPYHRWLSHLDFRSGALSLAPFFPGQTLSARNLGVIRGNLMGLPSTQIARNLNTSQGTVKKCLSDLHGLCRSLHVPGHPDYSTREILHHTQLAAFIAANPGWLDIDAPI